MVLVFGLGNPTRRYAHTRHNVGFDTIDRVMASFHKKLKRRCFRLYSQRWLKFANGKALFVKPLTYMNNSGKIIPYFITKKFKSDNLLVICDNLDLEVGTIRIRRGGSSAGHRGLKSLIEELGSPNFVRLYIGVGRPPQGADIVDYVLKRAATAAEQTLLNQSLDRAAEAVLAFCQGASLEELTREYNRKNGSL
ncbi:MAG: aminoacyl-tRNA hydrolase [Sphaerochaetaceae bacterium]